MSDKAFPQNYDLTGLPGPAPVDSMTADATAGQSPNVSSAGTGGLGMTDVDPRTGLMGGFDATDPTHRQRSDHNNV